MPEQFSTVSRVGVDRGKKRVHQHCGEVVISLLKGVGDLSHVIIFFAIKKIICYLYIHNRNYSLGNNDLLGSNFSLNRKSFFHCIAY